MGENKIMEKLSKLNNMKTFTITERYDITNAKKLLLSDILDEEYKGSLNKYLKKGKNGRVEVEYTQNEIGRLNIKVKGLKEGETCIAQAYMKGVCKSALCSKYYYDLDMINAHPTFLEHVLKEKGFDCAILSHYNENRDKFFNKMAKKGLDRDSCKTLIIKIFYNGGIPSFCKDNNIKPECIPDMIYDLEKELKTNTQELLKRNELLPYRMKAIENKGADHYNLDGTAMSYYLQTIESRCLMALVDILKKKRYMIGALIHDGLHVVKDERLKNKKILEILEQELQHNTGIKIGLKVKPFTELPELNDMIVIKTDKEGADYISDKLKNDYIISQERIFMRIDNVWTENDKVIKRNLIKVIGNMNIFMEKIVQTKEGTDIQLSPHSTMKKGCLDMLVYVEPTEDPDFIDKLWSSNIYKLCFRNGYYNFRAGRLQDYDNDTHTTIKINRELKMPDMDIVDQVYKRILNPIFNNDTGLMKCWLNYIARGLAGHIEDKNWGVGIGERDCGKGVLVGMLENCFGEYCRSTNSENFLFKKGQSDSAKALSWLVPFEFKRLLLTNEITIDSEGKIRINGNTLKKLSSGGDKIEARVNHKDEINFKIQARVCMFCNDLPPIEPADTKETSYMFRFPSKFLNSDDDRLGKPIMRPVMYETEEGEVKYELDEDGEKKMINICNFYKKDDDIKAWCRKEEVMNAFIYIIFQNYGDKALIPDNMKEEMNDFKEEEKEEDIFLSLFNFPNDKEWDENKKDWISMDHIKVVMKKAQLSLSAQKYKNYLLGKGCMKAKRLDDYSGKRVNCWVNIQINDNKVKQVQGCFMDSDDED
jgi:hypothetical protein